MWNNIKMSLFILYLSPLPAAQFNSVLFLYLYGNVCLYFCYSTGHLSGTFLTPSDCRWGNQRALLSTPTPLSLTNFTSCVLSGFSRHKTFTVWSIQQCMCRTWHIVGSWDMSLSVLAQHCPEDAVSETSWEPMEFLLVPTVTWWALHRRFTPPWPRRLLHLCAGSNIGLKCPDPTTALFVGHSSMMGVLVSCCLLWGTTHTP